MNKKMVVKNKFGEVVYCVLCEDQPLKKQLEKVLGITSGQGFSVEMDDRNLYVRDFYSGENAGEFEIISLSDTDLPQALNWIKED